MLLERYRGSASQLSCPRQSVSALRDMPHTCLMHRFSARGREYKYYILQHGELDIEAMQQAAAQFVGEHDFRNFCKVDAQHVSNFRRTVLDFRQASHPCHQQGKLREHNSSRHGLSACPLVSGARPFAGMDSWVLTVLFDAE